ncbi:MAG: 30S ribosome-binding factor RbfA [Actinomycetota bacterium]|nr:30S ribosome-binding factor RbfA [Actinomycetota bacterium]
MATERMRRVNEVMREVIGDSISTELEDPRIGFVTVTAVKTSPDLRAARVFVSVLGGEDEREATLKALASAHGVLQAAIASQTRMKRTPTLTFVYDDTPERGVRLTRLLEDDPR